MKNIILMLWIACLLAACNNDNTTKNATEAETKTPVTYEPVCYTGALGRDTVNFSVRNTGDSISGNLDYLFYEKDQNHGIISGMMRGDTLFAKYNFGAEGMQSVREVAFLKKGNTLVEGYGDMIDKDGRMIFKDISTLHFSDGFVLHQVECAKL